MQELLSDPLNISALPSSDNNKWKEENEELKTKLVSESVQRTLLTQVFLDKEKASKARIQELERQLAAAKRSYGNHYRATLPSNSRKQATN